VNFSLDEFIASQIASRFKIDNRPPANLIANCQWTLAGLDRIRAVLGSPMILSSGYRCPQLNKVVGGSERSQHMTGQAADFTCPGFGDPQAIAEVLAPMRHVLGIDQLILESTWVHVSFTLNPRYEILRCVGPGEYLKGLSDGST